MSLSPAIPISTLNNAPMIATIITHEDLLPIPDSQLEIKTYESRIIPLRKW